MTRKEFAKNRAKVLNAINDAIFDMGLVVVGYDDTGEFPIVLLDCKSDEGSEADKETEQYDDG